MSSDGLLNSTKVNGCWCQFRFHVRRKEIETFLYPFSVPIPLRMFL